MYQVEHVTKGRGTFHGPKLKRMAVSQHTYTDRVLKFEYCTKYLLIKVLSYLVKKRYFLLKTSAIPKQIN